MIISVSSEFVPNSTNDQNSKLDSIEKQVRELSTLLKEQLVNALNQTNTRTSDVNNKSRQNATRFCHHCRRNGHTLHFCRAKASDDERKRQYNREIQQKKPTFTNDYNERKGATFGSQNYHNSNSQHNSNSSQRYGNNYSQPYIRNQSFNNQNHSNQINSIQGQNQRTGQNNDNFPARQNNNSNTQYHTNQTSEMAYVSLKETMIQSLKIKQPLLIAYQQTRKRVKDSLKLPVTTSMDYKNTVTDQKLLLDQSSPSGTMMQIDSYTTLSQKRNSLRNRLLRTTGHPLRI